jgi:hypothetical protein
LPLEEARFGQDLANLLLNHSRRGEKIAVMEARCSRKPTAPNPGRPGDVSEQPLDAQGTDAEKLRSERPSGVGMHHATRHG